MSRILHKGGAIGFTIILPGTIDELECKSPDYKDMMDTLRKVLYLIPAYTSTLYWHNIILKKAAEIRLLIGRLKFGDQKDVAPLHIALVILDSRLKGNPKFVSYKR